MSSFRGSCAAPSSGRAQHSRRLRVSGLSTGSPHPHSLFLELLSCESMNQVHAVWWDHRLTDCFKSGTRRCVTQLSRPSGGHKSPSSPLGKLKGQFSDLGSCVTHPVSWRPLVVTERAGCPWCLKGATAHFSRICPVNTVPSSRPKVCPVLVFRSQYPSASWS